MSPEENEAVVAYALQKVPSELVPIELPLPHALGLTEWQGSFVLRRRHLVIVGVSFRINGGSGCNMVRAGGGTLIVKLVSPYCSGHLSMRWAGMWKLPIIPLLDSVVVS